MGCCSYRGKGANEGKGEARSRGRHCQPAASQPVRGECVFQYLLVSLRNNAVFAPVTSSSIPSLPVWWEGRCLAICNETKLLGC